MQTGVFTALDGGVYGVTSESGYVVVDGKTMSPGQGALIGNERVSEGSSGFVANGMTLLLTPVTTMPAATAVTTSSGSTSTGTSTLATTASALSSAPQAAASVASTSSTAAAGAPTQYAGNVGWVAAAGGLLGLLVL